MGDAVNLFALSLALPLVLLGTFEDEGEKIHANNNKLRYHETYWVDDACPR